MSETIFGPGGHVLMPADVPSAMEVVSVSAETGTVAFGEDANPTHTEYALALPDTGMWVGADGVLSGDAVWRTRAEWGDEITVTGLSPATAYEIRAVARNSGGVESAPGPPALLTTYWYAEDVLSCAFEVVKASSTISAPVFMSVLAPDIVVAGKPLVDLGMYVDTITGFDVPETVPDEELIPGEHAWRIWNEFIAPKRILLEGHIHGESPSDLRLRLAYLKSFLATFGGDPWRSSSPVKLSRSDMPGRHREVYYEHFEEIEPLGKRALTASAKVRIRLKCADPCEIDDTVTRQVCGAATGSFTMIELGNAPSGAVYTLTGPADNPSIVVGDMVFLCDFAEGLAYSDVSGDSAAGTCTPADAEAGLYTLTDNGVGIHVTNSATIHYTANGNTHDGAWVVVFVPDWQATAMTDTLVVLEHRADADNYLRLYWDGANRRWVFRKCADGVESEACSPGTAFTAGTPVVLGIAYDRTNAGGMKLYVDGAVAGNNDNVQPLASPPGTVYLHAAEGTGQADGIFDLVAGWSRMLSSDEMRRIAHDPAAVRNRNTAFTWAGTLDEGDMLTLDSQRRTASLFDVSAGARTNALPGVGGDIPMLVPGRRRTVSDTTQTMVYAASGAADLQVRYRKKYL